MCIYTKYKSVLIIFIVCSSFVHTYLFFCSIHSPSLFASQCVDLFCYFFLFRCLPLSLTHSFAQSFFLSVFALRRSFLLLLLLLLLVVLRLLLLLLKLSCRTFGVLEAFAYTRTYTSTETHPHLRVSSIPHHTDFHCTHVFVSSLS